MNNEQCTIFAQTERSSQIHLDDAEVQPKITQKRSGCVMNDEQWRKVKLEEVGEINPSNKEPIHSQFVYIDLESVVAGKLLVENHILRENAPSRAQRLVYYNDVLYQTVRPYQRNNYIHKKQGNYVASTGYALIRCYDDYEPDFVYYLLHTHNFESIVLGLCTGTSYPAIAPNNLKRIKISIPFKNDKPDFPAQRRIAAILTSADKVIAATQKTIAKYKQIKQGMMEDLLNEQCTMNNVQWKKVKLGECCDKITDGCHIKPKCVAKSQFLMLSSQNIKDNKLDLSDVSYLTFDDFERENHRTNIKAGDVLLTIVGTVGRTYLVKENDVNFTLQRSVAVLAPKATLDSSFLLYTLNNLQFVLENEAHGCAQKGIYLKQLNQLLISIPDLAAQRRIAAILSGIDAKIAAEEKVLQKYEKVKKGLMERMLKE